MKNIVYNAIARIAILNCERNTGKEMFMKNKKMKIARLEMDMNQQQLADAVGVTRQTISMIESGNYNPTLNLCISICRVLNKTLDELFWVENEEGELS